MPGKITIREVAFSNFINNDASSGADQDLVTWKPDLGDGYYYLGPSASNRPSDVPHGIVVKELEPGQLVDVLDWRQVWNDRGSGKPTDFALWQAVSPSPNYAALASFFTRSHDKPSAADAAGIKCIHRDLLSPAFANQEVWTDRGSGADQDGAVWSLYVNSEHAFTTGAFVAVSGYNNPPTDIFGVKRESVQAVTRVSKL